MNVIMYSFNDRIISVMLLE